MKLWAGRFQKETDTLVNDFNSSIAFDARMYKEDIAGSIAHAAMLGKQGIIEEHEAEKIIDGLKAILDAADKYGYTVLVTADHGNADQMTETKKGKTSVRTAHSLNPVPFIIYDKDHTWVIKDGAYGLANVAPTIVKMMGLTAPDCWEQSMV